MSFEARLQTHRDMSRAPAQHLFRYRHLSFFQSCVEELGLDSPSTTVTKADMEASVDNYLAAVRRMGEESNDDTEPLSNARARDLCSAWVRNGWLISFYDEDGSTGEPIETYRLTGDTLDVLKALASTGAGRRSQLNGSRLESIMTAADRTHQYATGDVAAMREQLEQQIIELTRQRDELDGGAATDPEVANARVLDGYLELLNLTSMLPNDFRHIAESMKRLNVGLINDIRVNKRSVGASAADHYAERNRLMHNDEQGRAFISVMEMLGDSTGQLERLTQQLDHISQHPAVQHAHRDSSEIETLRAIPAMIADGYDMVREEIKKADIQLNRFLNAVANHEYRAAQDKLDALIDTLAEVLPDTPLYKRMDPVFTSAVLVNRPSIRTYEVSKRAASIKEPTPTQVVDAVPEATVRTVRPGLSVQLATRMRRLSEPTPLHEVIASLPAAPLEEVLVAVSSYWNSDHVPTDSADVVVRSLDGLVDVVRVPSITIEPTRQDDHA